MGIAGALVLGSVAGVVGMDAYVPGPAAVEPRGLLALLASVGVALVLAAGLGLLLAELSGLTLPSMILAAVPGGIAEMCITAKVLHLGVPVVTAHSMLFVSSWW